MLASPVISRYSDPMKINANKVSVATLIRDGYLTEDEVDDAERVALSRLQWADDYRQYQLDQIDD